MWISSLTKRAPLSHAIILDLKKVRSLFGEAEQKPVSEARRFETEE
jgi:hypothetical protein